MVLSCLYSCSMIVWLLPPRLLTVLRPCKYTNLTISLEPWWMGIYRTIFCVEKKGSNTTSIQKTKDLNYIKILTIQVSSHRPGQDNFTPHNFPVDFYNSLLSNIFEMNRLKSENWQTNCYSSVTYNDWSFHCPNLNTQYSKTGSLKIEVTFPLTFSKHLFHYPRLLLCL